MFSLIVDDACNHPDRGSIGYTLVVRLAMVVYYHACNPATSPESTSLRPK